MRLLTIFLTGAAVSLSACAMTQATVNPDSGRTVERSLKDITAARAIKARMLRVEGFDLNDISVDVAQGIVVLAGAAPRAEDKVEAERIAWSAPSITQVGNEVYVGNTASFFSKTKDEAITTAIRTKMAASSAVRNLNYDIETRNGVVYLLGIARSENELAEAARIASVTRGVSEVVSYATIKGDMPNSYNSGGSGDQIAYSPSASASASTSSIIPYSPNTYQSEAPLAYRPGISEINPDTMGPTQLDSDAIESGEPYFRDPVTGQRITLPDDVKPIPYVPDMGPGSLGAGGAALPPGVKPSQILGVSYNESASIQDSNVVPVIAVVESQPSDITRRSFESTSEQGTPPAPITQAQPEVVWNGNAWVYAQ